jgi:hemoglobin/transferrin/lactoferrin receptor protein
MKNILFTCLCMLMYALAYSQLITVNDAVSRRPLEYVTVYDIQLKTTLITNPSGQVSVSLQNDTDSLYLSLLGYEARFVTLQQLKENKFRVYMNPGPVTLKPFEVSAIRWQHGSSSAPEQMQVLTASDIAFQNPQTAADMLAGSGNVFVQKSQMGGGSPMIRGFAANRVLIVVDGVRMNNAIFRSGNLHNVISADPFNIERAEVIFGPGSVAFGSDAIGGVMSFSTFEPGLSATDKMRINGKGLTRWSSVNNESTAMFNLNIGMKKWAFLTVAGISEFDDLKTGSKGPNEFLRPHYVETINGNDSMFVNLHPKVQKFSAYSAFNIMQKVRFKPNRKFDFNYTFLRNTTSDIPRYDRLTEYSNGVLRNAEWYYGPQKWMMNSLNFVHNDSTVFYDKAIVTIAMQNFEESRNDRKFNNNWLRTQTETVDVFSGNFDFSKKLTKSGILLYGLEAMLNNVGSQASRTHRITGENEEVGTRYPDGSVWNSYAAYALYKHKIGERINLPVGIRYTHVAAHTKFDTAFYPLPFTTSDVNTGTVNGSAGMVYRANEHWQFTLNLTSGFRAPNIDDMGKVFESEPGSVVVPNPDLKPEYAYSAEIGITKVFGKRARIDVTGFYTYLEDALVRRDYTLNGVDSMLYNDEMSRIQAIQNAAFAQVYGVSANFELKLPAGFGLISAFNWQKGEEELDNGEKAPLRHAAPVFGMSKLTFSRQKLRAEIVFMFHGSIPFEQMAPSERDKPYMYAIDNNGNPWSPSWQTMGVRCSYELYPGIQFLAGVENIFDVRYRSYSSGISAPGRNFVISMNASF